MPADSPLRDIYNTAMNASMDQVEALLKENEYYRKENKRLRQQMTQAADNFIKALRED